MKRFYLFFVLILCLAGVQAQRFVQYATDSSRIKYASAINVRNVPAGVYLLRVTDTYGREYQRKIVKK